MNSMIGNTNAKRAQGIAWKTSVLGMILSALFVSGWSSAKETSQQPGVSPEQQQRLERMKSKGPEASLTILPIRLAGKPFDRVTEIVGLLLEEQGLKAIELGKTAFDPGNMTATEQMTASLGEFIRKDPIATEYALYAEYNGNRQTGVDDIRAAVVDRTGAVVWTDRQTPRDAGLKGQDSRDLLELSALLVERLSPQMGLNEETAKAAKPGPMARIMDQRSGMPPEDERTPLPGRQKKMKELGQKATLMVFPARIGGAVNAEGATDLAKMINDAGLCTATPAKQSPLLNVSYADPNEINEMKALWDLARAFRDYAKKNPVDADYALCADYGFNPQNWEQGAVHFVVCDRQGEWVIVDMQNSHDPDYRSVKPTSREDCDRLLFKSLEAYLR